MPVTVIRSMEDLNRFKQEAQEAQLRKFESGAIQVVVSLGSCGIAAGALDVYNILHEQIEAASRKDIYLSKTGCIGLCRNEPILEVTAGGERKATYGRVTPEGARSIFRQHILGGEVVREYLIEPTALTLL
jgi:NADP-reducing hydrogenase subunit HndB